jgi:hypothetical protein
MRLLAVIRGASGSHLGRNRVAPPHVTAPTPYGPQSSRSEPSAKPSSPSLADMFPARSTCSSCNEPATGGRYCEAHHEILTTQGDIDAE